MFQLLPRRRDGISKKRVPIVISFLVVARKATTRCEIMMNVTVTGATGKLGIYVCRTLVNAGYNVRATDKRYRRQMPVKLEVIDLLDRDACYRLMTAAEAVVHLGNYSDMVISDVQKLFNENVAINMNVFQSAQETGVRHIVFASSIQVLGTHSASDGELRTCVPYLPLDGNAPANPDNAYALSKLVGEVYVAVFRPCAHEVCRDPLSVANRACQAQL